MYTESVEKKNVQIWLQRYMQNSFMSYKTIKMYPLRLFVFFLFFNQTENICDYTGQKWFVTDQVRC